MPTKSSSSAAIKVERGPCGGFEELVVRRDLIVFPQTEKIKGAR